MKVPKPEPQCTLIRFIRPSIHPSTSLCVYRGCVVCTMYTVKRAKATKIRIHFNQNHFPSFCILSTSTKNEKKINISSTEKSFSSSNSHRHTRSHFGFVIFVHKIIGDSIIATGNIITIHISYTMLCVYACMVHHDPFFFALLRGDENQVCP